MPVTEEFTDPAERIERVIAQQDRRFRRAFVEALATIQNRWTLDELADLLEQGRFEEALDGLQAAAAALGAQYGASLSAAATEAATFLSSSLSVLVAFDVTNDRAVQMMRRNSLRLIQGFTQGQIETTRSALLDGIRRGLNPVDQARLFRSTVGLTPNQELAVQRFRALLTARANGSPSREALNRALRDGRSDRLIERMIREGGQLTPAQIDSMVARYERRAIALRARTIARTEALRSVHEGTEEMYRQAIELGEFRADQLQRTWKTAEDERVRGSHVRLNGTSRPLGEPWLGDAGPIMYPGDPDADASETINCRCALSTRVLPPSPNRNQ